MLSRHECEKMKILYTSYIYKINTDNTILAASNVLELNWNGTYRELNSSPTSMNII